MCQQWFSIIGLVLDVVGFLIIAKEWHDSFLHNVFIRQDAVQRDYERTTAAAKDAPYNDPTEADASMWRNTQRENILDNRRRARLFFSGLALVVLGFLGQVIGSWPYGFFGIKSC